MATSNTFKMNNENEAIALVNYFSACGISASRKGAVVKASGETSMLAYLYEKFVTIALI